MSGTIQKIWLRSFRKAKTAAVLRAADTRAMAKVGLRPIRCVTTPNVYMPTQAPRLIISEVMPFQ